MVIADIDQDFFYRYIDGTSFDGESKTCSRRELKKSLEFSELYNKYNLSTAKGFRIFNNHDEVYYELKKMGTEAHHLLHFDRHDDVGFSTNSQDMPVNAGNFISYLAREEIISRNEWITLDITDSEDDFIYNCPYNISTYTKHKPGIKIDYVYFTISEDFCPDNSILLDFINIMNGKDIINKDARFL